MTPSCELRSRRVCLQEASTKSSTSPFSQSLRLIIFAPVSCFVLGVGTALVVNRVQALHRRKKKKEHEEAEKGEEQREDAEAEAKGGEARQSAEALEGEQRVHHDSKDRLAVPDTGQQYLVQCPCTQLATICGPSDATMR
eukprot:1621085-Rhodomonas_salina.2